MLLRLVLLFTLIPLVELALLFLIAEHAGGLVTLLLVILTGVAGAWLARWQGVRCWRQVHEQMARGQLPAGPLLDGLMILVAAVLLITPGVLTDLLGFALLVPPIRKLIGRGLAARLNARMVVYRQTDYQNRPTEDDDVIDFEHRRLDDV